VRVVFEYRDETQNEKKDEKYIEKDHLNHPRRRCLLNAYVVMVKHMDLGCKWRETTERNKVSKGVDDERVSKCMEDRKPFVKKSQGK